MRLIIVFLLFIQISFAQKPFKTIPFNTNTSNPVVSNPAVKLPDLINRSHQNQPIAAPVLRRSLIMGLPGNGVNVPNTLQDPHSFWDASTKPVSFNLRSANSSVYTFLNQFKTKMQVQDVTKEFEFIKSETDGINMQHVRVQQMYRGIPVYGGELVLHGVNNTLDHINGRVYATPTELNTSPDLTADLVQSIVKGDLASLGLYHETSAALLKIKKKEPFQSELVIYNDESNVPHLAYDVTMISGMDTWYYKVDAHTGSILKKYNNTCSFLPRDHTSFLNENVVRSGSNAKTSTNTKPKIAFDFSGKTTTNAVDLNGQTLTLNTYLDGSTYYLVDAARPMFVDIGNDNQEPTGVIWTFDGLNKSPAKSNFNPALINAPSNSNWITATAASAHSNAAIAYAYYLNTHNRNSINGKGGNITSLINITEDDGSQMDNAFWDGEAMYYGNGDKAFTALAKAIDVAGHEMSHGVIQSTANLDYDTQSGALNESFADIFGRLIDRGNWLIGESVVKKSVFPTGALRSFIDPHNGGSQIGDGGYQPRTVAEGYKGSQDNGGVHINSGINNWAFYKFTTTINNDLSKAEKIYYRALSQYLTRSSQYIDCRKAVIQSAADLYGANGPEVTAAKAAYDAVGILDGASTKTQTDVQTNPGIDFVVYADDAQTKLILADGTGAILADPLTTVPPLSKPSVTDDGSAIIFVGKDKKIHYILIDWSKNQVTTNDILQGDPIWRNAVISKDGNRFAAIKDVKEPKISVYDYTIGQSGEWREFTLYNPTYSQGKTTGIVDYPDAMEFDHTSQELMYDAQSTIKTSTGVDIQYWDISFLSVYNANKATWGDGSISKLFSQLPEKTSVGNPTFAKNSPYIVAFDMLIEGATSSQNSYLLLGGNIETSKVDTIFINNDLSFPSYSSTDKQVLFNYTSTSTGNVLAVINTDASKIQSVGSGKVFSKSKARLGTWFSNGDRNLNTATVDAANIAKYHVSISPNPTSDLLTVKWTQPQTGSTNHFAIYDMMGSLVWSTIGRFVKGDQSLAIPVTSLSTGIYVMKINVDGNAGAVKFIKQ
jgi:Zn-dependent metalloprotease